MPRFLVSVRLMQAVFWSAAVFALACAVMPGQDEPQIVSWDKGQHFLAFYTLTLLAVLAFPRVRPLALAAALSGFGAVIELLQGIPFVHRDMDFWDWVADSVAIFAAVVPILVGAWRTRIRENIGVAPARAPDSLGAGMGREGTGLAPGVLVAPVQRTGRPG